MRASDLHLSTGLLMVLVGLHLLRVFASGSFKRPREGNWIIGVALAGITAIFFFSGTVLKWDQESLEALEHNVELGRLLGRFGYWLSPEFGGIPLLHRLYTLHIAILPAIFFLVVAVHLMLVKLHGWRPRPSAGAPCPSRPSPSRGISRGSGGSR